VLFPIITAPYISRVLGVESIGVIRFVMANVGYFALFAALGIGFYGVRELAKVKDDQEKCSQLFSSLFTITFCSTLVVTLLFLLGINLIPEFRAHRLLFSIYGITLYLIPISMDWYFQGKENFKMIAFRSFVVKLLALIALFVFVRERSDVVPYILISAFSIIATYVWNLSYAYKTGLRISFRHIELRRHISPMFIFLSSSAVISVSLMLDTVMLGFLSSYEQVGYYTSANLILGAIIGSCVAINTVLLPRLSFYKEQKDDITNTALLQKTFDLNTLLIIPMAIGLCLVASRFVPLFFGSEFFGSIVPMQILSFALISNVLCNFFVLNVLFVSGLEKKYLFVVICTTLISVTLNLFLIPRYGAIGTAIVAIISTGCLQLGLNLYFVYKFTQTRIRWNSLAIATLCSLSFWVLYYFCDKFILKDFAFLGIFICLSVIVYFVLQMLTKNYLLQQMIEIGTNKIKNKNE
jgi:O-antigen/teichoic acid export membrane protein